MRKRLQNSQTTVRSDPVQADTCIYRGYLMAARGNEFYLRVLKVSLTSERSELLASLCARHIHKSVGC